MWVHDILEGPENKVKSWPMYFTRGYMFHTREHGAHKKTMNYGIYVRGQNYSDASHEDDFYGTVEQIIELTYPGILKLNIILFYCQWFDPTVGKGTRKNEVGVVDVLSSRKYPKYEPFILASQADQVFYLPYPNPKRSRKTWLSVVKVNPRNRIQGKFVENEEVILQQTVDETTTLSVDDLHIDGLVDVTHPMEGLAFEIGDEDPTDEFQCNLSDHASDEEPCDDD